MIWWKPYCEENNSIRLFRWLSSGQAIAHVLEAVGSIRATNRIFLSGEVEEALRKKN